MTLDANGGTIIDAVQFADLLAATGPQLQQQLGIADLAELDLEDMTATAEGGLLLGLKAPLGARGEALIWRLGRPDRLLAGEGLTARPARGRSR